MTPDDTVVIEVFGEGKTDVGQDQELKRPNQGVVPILLHKLCRKDERMRVKCRPLSFLQRGGLPRKVQFVKQQAGPSGSHAVVFVVDAEGPDRQWKERWRELDEGRNRSTAPTPVAVGVAQPCIEAWLLADATAIRRGLELPSTPTVTEHPESLPAPCENERVNPKRVLAEAAGVQKKDLSAEQKWSIAGAINDTALVRTRCPLSFAPFADEVEQHIQPLFSGTTLA